MNSEKPFLLIIEATEGLNTHSTYTNFKQAKKERDNAFKADQHPICIFNLLLKKVLWENNSFPAYGETISNSIIQLYIK